MSTSLTSQFTTTDKTTEAHGWSTLSSLNWHSSSRTATTVLTTYWIPTRLSWDMSNSPSLHITTTWRCLGIWTVLWKLWVTSLTWQVLAPTGKIDLFKPAILGTSVEQIPDTCVAGLPRILEQPEYFISYLEKGVSYDILFAVTTRDELFNSDKMFYTLFIEYEKAWDKSFY